MEVSELNTSIGEDENEDDYLKAANKQKKIARGENPTWPEPQYNETS